MYIFVIKIHFECIVAFTLNTQRFGLLYHLKIRINCYCLRLKQLIIEVVKLLIVKHFFYFECKHKALFLHYCFGIIGKLF
jgi:hypothetical protein